MTYLEEAMIGELFLSLVLVWLVWYIITTYMTRRNMPPGPFPYPFIGNMPHMMCDPINPLGKLAERYGDIFTVTFPGVGASVVVLSSASLVREATLGRQDDLSGRSPASFYPLGEIFGEDLLTADYSPKFRFRRRVFKSAMHVFGAGIEEASQRVGHAVDIAIGDLQTRQGMPFSPKKLFESSILVQLWEWLTSKKVQLNDPTIKCLSVFGEIVSKQSMFKNTQQLIPFMKYLPTQFNRNIKLAQQIKNEIFHKEYQAHIETYTPGIIRDLTDSFISCYEKEIGKETTKNIGSMDDIASLMCDVSFGGSDTTSTSLAWLFLYMILHPDVQMKVHKELDVVVGNERLPNWTDVENMPYLQATLCEVQRSSGLLANAGTNAIRDTTIGGYHIPKGTLVDFGLAKLHHDEREWPEPEKFKPERFLDSDGKFVGWSKLHGFLPFAVGRRECPGQSLAKIMMFTFASVLLYLYKIEIPEGEEIPTAEVSAPAAIMPPNDFNVVAKKRNHFIIKVSSALP